MMRQKKFQDVPADFFVSPYCLRRPVDWEAQFRRRAPLVMEIGFGMGDFLIRAAGENPQKNFVGLENDWPRLNKTLGRIQRINAAGDSYLGNIRLLKMDATVALERFFAPRSIADVFCLFPCPWPKKRHIKYRLFCRDFLRLINSRLKGGGILKIVTDSPAYAEWIRQENVRSGFRLTTGTVRPRYDTKYERKWREAGQRDFHELLFKKKRHINVPLKKDVRMKKYYVDHFSRGTFTMKKALKDATIVFKDYIFDEKKHAGMLHAIVAEPSLTQHVWIRITRCRRAWEIALAEGQSVLPTRGVARALAVVSRQASAAGRKKIKL